jgi:hypothetical protein
MKGFDTKMVIKNILELIKEYWFLIIAITAFFHYYYKKEMTKYEAWQKKYFSKVLVPFHLQYLTNLPFDINNFIKQKKLIEKKYVPSYIHYLVRREAYGHIINVMLVDYERNNPSPTNLSFRAKNKIFGVISFIFDFCIALLASLSFTIVILAIAFIFCEIITFIINGHWNVISSNGTDTLQIWTYIIIMPVASTVTGVLLFLLKMNNHGYCYSSDRIKVEKLIAQKLKRFEKISANLIYSNFIQKTAIIEKHDIPTSD